MAEPGFLSEMLTNKVIELGITTEEFSANLLIAVLLIILGIFLGKAVKFFLRKGLGKLNVEKFVKPSFVKLFLVIIKWSIYILFINLALTQLNVPSITTWLTTTLSVIPTLTGALIILAIGFMIASYLKKIVIESKVQNWQIFSQVFFYFITFIFMIFAFRTAMIPMNDRFISNILIAVFTFLGGLALILLYKEKNNM